MRQRQAVQQVPRRRGRSLGLVPERARSPFPPSILVPGKGSQPLPPVEQSSPGPPIPRTASADFVLWMLGRATRIHEAATPPPPSATEGRSSTCSARVLPRARASCSRSRAAPAQHAVFFAARLPALTWQPTDRDPPRAASRAWRAEAACRTCARRSRSTSSAGAWPVGARRRDRLHQHDPHRAVGGEPPALFARRRAAARRRRRRSSSTARSDRGGRHTAPSNARFDASLRARDPRWGVRDLDDVERAAERPASRERGPRDAGEQPLGRVSPRRPSSSALTSTRAVD